jgi:hypothetical protein
MNIEKLNKLKDNFMTNDSEETFMALVEGYKEHFGEDLYKDVLYMMFNHMDALTCDYLYDYL